MTDADISQNFELRVKNFWGKKREEIIVKKGTAKRQRPRGFSIVDTPAVK